MSLFAVLLRGEQIPSSSDKFTKTSLSKKCQTQQKPGKKKPNNPFLGESYLKNSNPGISNIIKIDGPVVRVHVAGHAHVVVLVPVDAGIPAGLGAGQAGAVGIHAQGALHLGLLPAGNVGAPLHPVLPVRGADEGVLLRLVQPVVGVQEGQVVRPGEGGKEGKG